MTNETVATCPEMEGPTPEQIRIGAQWCFTALIFGYNELVKLVPTLREKVYFRIMRERAHADLLDAGGSLDIKHEPPVLTLPNTMPQVEFRASDIALMRPLVEAENRTKLEVTEERLRLLTAILRRLAENRISLSENETATIRAIVGPEFWP